MRKLFAMVLIAAVAGFATGSAEAHCGTAHPCEGDYCTR